MTESNLHRCLKEMCCSTRNVSREEVDAMIVFGLLDGLGWSAGMTHYPLSEHGVRVLELLEADEETSRP